MMLLTCIAQRTNLVFLKTFCDGIMRLVYDDRSYFSVRIDLLCNNISISLAVIKRILVYDKAGMNARLSCDAPVRKRRNAIAGIIPGVRKRVKHTIERIA